MPHAVVVALPPSSTTSVVLGNSTGSQLMELVVFTAKVPLRSHWHAVPLPICPVGHWHVKPPGVFVQVAAESQLLVFVAHSSMSVQVTPLPE